MIFVLCAAMASPPPQSIPEYRPPEVATVDVSFDNGVIDYSIHPTDSDGAFEVRSVTFTLHRTGVPDVVWSETPATGPGGIEHGSALVVEAPRHLAPENGALPTYLEVETEVSVDGRRRIARAVQVVVGEEPALSRTEIGGVRVLVKPGFVTSDEQLVNLDAGVEVDVAGQ